ncbi:MAG: right-handed parallel beta-helix repeat-containing protein [Planctomycetes bacterium]|nr:right-handed parallel beta-helix repeat-containing protein [Planctomycetota bacterium]
MKKTSFLALLLASLLPAAASAGVAWVKPGDNFRSIVNGASPGTVVNVRAGTYSAHTVIPKNNVVIRSFDGPHKAVIDGGGSGEILYLSEVSGVLVDGLEIRHSGSNAVKIFKCSNVTLRNCKVHDAGRGGDCIKVTTRCANVVIDGCEVFDPGHRSDKGWQENIDFIDSDDCSVRNCLLYHVGSRGDMIGYFKGGSSRCAFEYNVVLNAAGGEWGNVAWALGQSTGAQYRDGPYECSDSAIRGNLFINCPFGGAGFYGCRNCFIYNNTFYNCGSRVGCVQFNRTGIAARPCLDALYLFNNVFIAAADSPCRALAESIVNVDGRFLHDHNSTWGAVTPPGDAHPFRLDPGLALPALPGPGDGFMKIASAFMLPAASPLRDKALPPENPIFPKPPLPDLASDPLGNRRPSGAWDLGAFEYNDPASAEAPSAGGRKILSPSETAPPKPRMADPDPQIASSLRTQLAAWIVAAAAAGRREQVYVTFLGSRQRATLTAADNAGFSAEILGVSQPFSWNSLSDKNFYRIASACADTRSAGAHLTLARFCVAAGLAAEAESEIASALEIDPASAARAEAALALSGE